MSAVKDATFVPHFLDGSLHTPQPYDAYVHIRLTGPAEATGTVTAYLADGTALVVRGRDLVRLAPADEPGK
jgi:hypothetical protein